MGENTKIKVNNERYRNKLITKKYLVIQLLEGNPNYFNGTQICRIWKALTNINITGNTKNYQIF